MLFSVRRYSFEFLFRCDDVRNSLRRRRKQRKSKEYPTLKKFDFLKEVTILIVLGIVVPTGDVYSDGALSYQMFNEATHFKCLNGDRVCIGCWCWDKSEKQGT